jgi:TolB-like protein/Tfp pilus assembly protein PilF
VHVGEVVESQGDISGDTVNVASRIEPLAEDGGICITRQVYDLVRNKVDIPFSSLGTKSLKNVTEQMEVYKMMLPWKSGTMVSPVQLDRNRVAVLPFANMSPDSSEDYFADGMTEELISALSGIGGLSVISRTSVMMLKKNPKPAREIARELEVGTILEGSVRKAGNKVRITVQMVDSRADRPLWSQSYDRNLDDIFAIQSDISQNVANLLKIRLLPSEKEKLQRAPTTDMEAHTLYLKGRYFVNERGTAKSPKDMFYRAIDYFEQAIKRDPHYAAAFAGISDCYQLLGNWGILEPRVAVEKGAEYALRALKLDDSLAEAHTSMAVALANQKWDWKGAEREYNLALKLNPSYVNGHHWYGIHLLIPLRRWDEGIREMREAEKLDPFSTIVAVNTGVALFYGGRRQEAISQLRHVLEMDPDSAYAHANLGIFLISTSFLEEGIAEVERAIALQPNELQFKPCQAFAYMVAGKKADAETVLNEMLGASRKQYVSALGLAQTYAVLGLRDQAFEWLHKGVDEHGSGLIGSLNDPMWDGIRDDSRFSDILRETGLA